MSMSAIFFVAAAAFIFANFGKTLSRTIVSPPLAFAAFGFIFGEAGLRLFGLSLDSAFTFTLVKLIAATYAFANGWRLIAAWRSGDQAMILRFALAATPFFIMAMTAIGLGLFPDLSLMAVLLVAAVVCSTDLSLYGADRSRAAAPLRRVQNGEAGVTVAIAVLLAAAFAEGARDIATRGALDWALFAGREFALPLLIGVVGGGALSWIMQYAVTRRLRLENYERWTSIATPIIVFGLSEAAGANGVVAALAAGAAACHIGQISLREDGAAQAPDIEPVILFAYVIFGATLFPSALAQADILVYAFALAAIVIVRPASIAIALFGRRLRPYASAMLCWTGPRGVLPAFLFLALADPALMTDFEQAFAVAGVAAGLSVVIHGLTARPSFDWFARRLEMSRRRRQSDEDLEGHPNTF